jgi:hypothetical protein
MAEEAVRAMAKKLGRKRMGVTVTQDSQIRMRQREPGRCGLF